MRQVFLVLFILLLTFLLTNPGQAAPHVYPAMPAKESAGIQSKLGTNLAEVTYYGTEYVFTDAFKASRPWLTQTDSSFSTNEYDQLDLDEDGWVRSLPAIDDSTVEYRFVGTLMFRDIGDHYPAGEYVVLYDGEGTIEYGFAANRQALGSLMPASDPRQTPSEKAQISADGESITYIFDGLKNEALSGPGRDVINVTPENAGIYLKISETNPNDYIRNIRVIMPGYEGSFDKFHADFVAKTFHYQVIRFMDWMQTNNSSQQFWQDRPTTNRATYAGTNETPSAGIPLETMIEVANWLDADPWFTMPHMADDNYITQFAQMTHDNLDGERKVIVEYSNEVWNGGFGQSWWVTQQGVAEWPTAPEDDSEKRFNWYGKRTAEICDIWKGVWAGDSDRVECVLGAQAANLGTGTQALDCQLWVESPCQDHGIEAVAIAPYFGRYLGLSEFESTLENWIANDDDAGIYRLFEEINHGSQLGGSAPANGAIWQAQTNIASFYALADSRNLTLVTYEGGQHLAGIGQVADNEAITNLFMEANRQWEMATAYKSYLLNWQGINSGVFVHYNSAGIYAKSGSWGALEFQDVAGSPKYYALYDFLNGNLLGDNIVFMPIVNR